MTVLASFRRLMRATLRWLFAPRAASASLRDLDARTLADIGVHRSEIASIEAESRRQAACSRRRIVALFEPV